MVLATVPHTPKAKSRSCLFTHHTHQQRVHDGACDHVACGSKGGPRQGRSYTSAEVAHVCIQVSTCVGGFAYDRVFEYVCVCV
eukprot:1158358-Pelagomonas_calceolata.AAC.8